MVVLTDASEQGFAGLLVVEAFKQGRSIIIGRDDGRAQIAGAFVDDGEQVGLQALGQSFLPQIVEGQQGDGAEEVQYLSVLMVVEAFLDGGFQFPHRQPYCPFGEVLQPEAVEDEPCRPHGCHPKH